MSRLICLSFFLLALPAVSQVNILTIDPAQPKNIDPILIKVEKPTCRYQVSGRVARLSSVQEGLELRTDIIFDDGGSPPFLSPDFSYGIGPLPAGTYALKWFCPGQQGAPNATLMFTVSNVNTVLNPSNPPLPVQNFSGSWWDPNESGWALALLQTRDYMLAVSWHVYDTNRQPVWYFGGGGRWVTPTEYSAVAYKTAGPYFGQAFTGGVQSTVVGTMRFTFGNANGFEEAVFDYDIEGVRGRKNIRRTRF